MSEKQVQQHSQHFNLSGEAKQKLEKLTARRYPGKQRRQSQLIEDLITQAFAKEDNMSSDTAGIQEPESDGLAPLTQAAVRMGQKMAQRLNATETTPKHLLLGLVLQSEEDVRDVFTALQVETPAIRSHLALRFIAEHQRRAEHNTDKSEQLKAEEFLTASEGSVAPATDMPLEHPPLSSEAQAAMKIALWMAKRMHSPLINPQHLLLGVLQDQHIQVLLAPLFPMAPLPELLHSYIEGSTQTKEQQAGVCPHCQRPVQAQWKHCVYCGRTLTKVCPKCGTPRAEVEGLRFCYECGAQLE